MFVSFFKVLLVLFTTSLISRFRLVALLEGITLLLFAITMPLKYGYGITQPNFIVGLIHGLLFMLYIALALRCWFFYGWTSRLALLAFVASFVPFGTFVLDARYLRHTKS
jgi:integral membrane protein